MPKSEVWAIALTLAVIGAALLILVYRYSFVSNCCVGAPVLIVVSDVHLSSSGAFSAAVKNDGTMAVSSLSYEISGLLPRANSSVTAATPLQPGQTILLTQRLTDVVASQNYTVTVFAIGANGSFTTSVRVVASG